MKNLLDEWKKTGFVLKPDPVKDALNMFMADYNMAKKSPNLDTYKVLIQARVRAAKAGKAVLKDSSHKAKLDGNQVATIFLRDKIGTLTGEYQQDIGNKVWSLDKEVSGELNKSLALIDQALSHKSVETFKAASQSCKHLGVFIDGLPTRSQERIAALSGYAVKVQLHVTATLKELQELSGETDAGKKVVLAGKLKNRILELQDLRAKIDVVARTNKLPEQLGALEAIGDAA